MEKIDPTQKSLEFVENDIKEIKNSIERLSDLERTIADYNQMTCDMIHKQHTTIKMLVIALIVVAVSLSFVMSFWTCNYFNSEPSKCKIEQSVTEKETLQTIK